VTPQGTRWRCISDDSVGVLHPWLRAIQLALLWRHTGLPFFDPSLTLPRGLTMLYFYLISTFARDVAASAFR